MEVVLFLFVLLLALLVIGAWFDQHATWKPYVKGWAIINGLPHYFSGTE
jgi:hypothetical protein